MSAFESLNCYMQLLSDYNHRLKGKVKGHKLTGLGWIDSGFDKIILVRPRRRADFPLDHKPAATGAEPEKVQIKTRQMIFFVTNNERACIFPKPCLTFLRHFNYFQGTTNN